MIFPLRWQNARHCVHVQLSCMHVKKSPILVFCISNALNVDE